MQQDYVSGILEEVKSLETFHAISFSQQLEIRTMYGKTIKVDDPYCLAEDLKTGRTYNFVIVVSGVERVRAFTQSNTDTGKMSGTIRQLKWQPTPDNFLVHDEELLEQPMSVVGTATGHVLLPRMLLGGVSVGNAVTWGRDEFQLVAVYK